MAAFDEEHPRGGDPQNPGRFSLKNSAGGHESQIPSAQPTIVGATHETYQQPSVEAMAADTSKVKGTNTTVFEHNIDLFSNEKFFPNFRASELVGSARERAAAIVN